MGGKRDNFQKQLMLTRPLSQVSLHIEQSLNDSRYAHEHMFDSDEIFKGILHNWLKLEPSTSLSILTHPLSSHQID